MTRSGTAAPGEDESPLRHAWSNDPVKARGGWRSFKGLGHTHVSRKPTDEVHFLRVQQVCGLAEVGSQTFSSLSSWKLQPPPEWVVLN